MFLQAEEIKSTPMKKFFAKIQFTKAEKLIIVVTIALLLSFWWFNNHVWFRIDSHKITINDQSAAERSDYSCFKSLNSDIFCYHQDNGTHYLISPQNNEISDISPDADMIHFEAILLSFPFWNSFYDANIKHKLPDEIYRKDGFIQFAPSWGVRRNQEASLFRIYY